MRPSKGLTAQIAVTIAAVAIVVVAAIAYDPPDRTVDDGPVTESDIQPLLTTIEEMALAGNVDDLCETVAASQSMCNRSVDDVRANGQWPVEGLEVVETREVDTGSLIVTVQYHLMTGETERGDMEILFDDAGELKAVNPIYWQGTKIGLLDDEREDGW